MGRRYPVVVWGAFPDPRSVPMAKKTTGAKAVQATAKPNKGRTGIAVRLELTPKDHERMGRLARKRGLTLASYARMVVMERMNEEEGIK
jgi:hypothetical protein